MPLAISVPFEKPTYRHCCLQLQCDIAAPAWWESYHSSWTILLFPWCSARSEVNQHNHINPRSRFFHTTVYAKPGHRFTWAILETTDSTYSDQYVRFDCQRNGSEHHGVWLRKPIVTTVEPLSMQVQMCNPHGGPISLQLQLTLPQTQQSGWKMSTSIPIFNAASVLNSGDYLDTVIEMAPNFCATDPTKAGQMAFACDIQI
ncbi:hypothetical protein X801_05862 [Opisthorchis viverrini]|uniref:Peptidase M60 domain-containing protein n=1 Tax=Opisthorchis viverrini TaxID=6198 RepID=A0A1S8WUW6_OPIVI|nr:hypothetical protein X801_05862 [Opisthorchis viverrini]